MPLTATRRRVKMLSSIIRMLGVASRNYQGLAGNVQGGITERSLLRPEEVELHLCFEEPPTKE
ncbi:putative extracellular elastinolytic metalloproteinase precursor [Moniliophthora roreri]|nr:putative extracellular elastinolytic metalloproteinase precursor [Moniliophthora roreri]